MEMWVTDSNTAETSKAFLLWDLLKVFPSFVTFQYKLRKSEEDEMVRLIGSELIARAEVFEIHHHQLQELKEQYNTMIDILIDVEETMPQANEAFSFEQKTAEFINKEISFFIDNLRKVNET